MLRRSSDDKKIESGFLFMYTGAISQFLG